MIEAYVFFFFSLSLFFSKNCMAFAFSKYAPESNIVFNNLIGRKSERKALYRECILSIRNSLNAQSRLLGLGT